ncbi:flagellar brake domain-containing protein [Virgibacillus sp. YIM 98842]|uniref:flagellar brake protein n=1 Tax=Virgibacillus sp. YIM 98842 TaxID=2663533 RepID=UPI0013DD016F|nr:flagellar brake domain-containing protein [Virgibacillus sp. YIM 98842]
MKIGTLLQLEYKMDGVSEVLKYYCKIIDRNDRYLFIDYPVNEKTKKTELLPKGAHFFAAYIGKDQSVYRFRTELVSKVSLNIPALAIKLPNKEDLKRIQRREFVRVKSAVDIAVYSDNNSFSPFTTVTDDISGGGMSIIVPDGINLELSKDIWIWMVLEMYNGEYQYHNIKAVFVHINKLNRGICIASLRFTALKQEIRQQIIRYCFEKQREARKKELQHF